MTWFGLGKIIVLGEHAVVYGYPALAAALDRGVTITAVPTPAGGSLRVDIPSWNVRLTAEDDHPLALGVAAIADAVGIGRPPVSLIGDAQIPAGAGLGSSAAFAVAIARALLDHAKQPGELAAVITAANASEKHVHGQASGIDVAIAAAGGIGVFRRSSGLRQIALPRPLRVLVGPSGAPRSTSAMVERVAKETAGSADDARLRELAALTDSGTASLLASELDALGGAMNRAHELLAGLGVSTPLLDGLCKLARDRGAHGAKLTGAGGGGAVIAIAPREHEAEVLAAWKTAGVTGFVATVGGRS